MNLTIERKIYSKNGIFSSLLDDNGNEIAVTLEHAYMTGPLGVWRPKIQNGIYNCVRGMHQLEGMVAPFETFEIMDVPWHSNILFHVGNFNRDSEGCVLLGEANSGNLMITNSRETFTKFMEIQTGCDSFTLEVVG